jgi:NAD+ diphosphatase
MKELPRLGRVRYDRAAHYRSDSDWLRAAWATARVILVSPEGTSPVERDEGALQLSYIKSSDVPASAPRRLLGIVDGVTYFSATVPGSDGWEGLRQIGPAADELEVSLLTSAIALQLWHSRHTHCPICGTATVETQAGWSRTCPADDTEHFPRTDPAVITLIHDDADHCLLGRGATWAAGRFSTIAGFVEPGESLESAVAREIEEEVGIEVTDIRYVASQPWPFPASIMLGFVCRVDGDPTVRVDGTELVEAGWFTRAEVERAAAWVDSGLEPDGSATVRSIPPRLSISRYLIDHWLTGDL